MANNISTLIIGLIEHEEKVRLEKTGKITEKIIYESF
jgi:hypothetical protein